MKLKAGVALILVAVGLLAFSEPTSKIPMSPVVLTSGIKVTTEQGTMCHIGVIFPDGTGVIPSSCVETGRELYYKGNVVAKAEDSKVWEKTAKVKFSGGYPVETTEVKENVDPSQPLFVEGSDVEFIPERDSRSSMFVRAGLISSVSVRLPEDSMGASIVDSSGSVVGMVVDPAEGRSWVVIPGLATRSRDYFTNNSK